RESCATGESQSEHRLVHVSRSIDYLYSIPLLLLANLAHFLVTYHLFHWKKGTPFADDQGIYNNLTWWEQIDDGKQLSRNRTFLTIAPVVLYLIASHTTDYQHPMLFLNTLAVFVLVVAKFPNMHKVRIFGINADK
ncbi:ORM1-like protein 2, partial [Hibiscus syriacus]|uniref:ORM1-like protein 2 n=1 Tax=Hibiscus syriacus TaxID=106335 RepID=UPI0019206355